MNSPVPISNPKIFLIEEDERERDMLESILHRERCKIHSIGFSRTIMQVLKQESPFDLILLGFRSSAISGVKVFRALAKEAPHTPIVIFCDLTNQETIKELKSYGAKHLLSKPITVKSVLFAVSQAARRDNPLEGTEGL